MERFLYRLAKSPHADRFILKGALLLTVWGAPVSRPTMDIDLAGQTDNRPDHIKAIMSAVCAAIVDPDGIEFSRDSIEVSRIKEDADYEGARVQFHATLARARIPMQLDIGFGDVISRLQTFEEKHEVAPGVVVCRTGGHTPGHSIVRLASGGDRLTFAGDAVFPVGFDRPDW
jgi:hypothetical protein